MVGGHLLDCLPGDSCGYVRRGEGDVRGCLLCVYVVGFACWGERAVEDGELLELL